MQVAKAYAVDRGLVPFDQHEVCPLFVLEVVVSSGESLLTPAHLDQCNDVDRYLKLMSPFVSSLKNLAEARQQSRIYIYLL